MSFQAVSFNTLAAVAFVTAVSASGVARAVDVENEDTKAYKVTLTEPGGKQDLNLAAGEKKMDLCAMCTVAVEGMQPVNASGLDRVVIKDGNVTKIEQYPRTPPRRP